MTIKHQSHGKPPKNLTKQGREMFHWMVSQYGVARAEQAVREWRLEGLRKLVGR